MLRIKVTGYIEDSGQLSVISGQLSVKDKSKSKSKRRYCEPACKKYGSFCVVNVVHGWRIAASRLRASRKDVVKLPRLREPEGRGDPVFLS